jgi:hypothetical protein
MKETFNHQVTASFYLWFDNYLLDKGEAYINEVSAFYPSIDETLPGFSIYAAPYKQFVWDSSISGAKVLSGVYPTNTDIFLTRGQSGIKFDYLNGRVFANTEITGQLAEYVENNYSGIENLVVSKNCEYFVYQDNKLVESPGLPDGYYYVVNGDDLDAGIYSIPSFTGEYARKEFNTYLTNEKDMPLVFEKIMGNNPNVEQVATGLAPYIYAAPCCIVSMSTSQNTPFSFGGQDRTETTARVLIVSKDMWQMDGIMSIFRDANNLTFPIIPSSGLPLDFYGDLKQPYNYKELAKQFCSRSNLSIDKVFTSRVSEKVNGNSSYFVSSLEFQLQAFRYPRKTV